MFGKNEKFIHDKETNKRYKYDIVLKENHKIIEINGTYWHCDPNVYKENYYNRVKRLTAKELWENDKHKISVANKFNYKVLTIWENEYNSDKNGTIQKCIDFLKS